MALFLIVVIHHFCHWSSWSKSISNTRLAYKVHFCFPIFVCVMNTTWYLFRFFIDVLSLLLPFKFLDFVLSFYLFIYVDVLCQEVSYVMFHIGLVVCGCFRWIHLKGILRLVEIFMENRCVNLIWTLFSVRVYHFWLGLLTWFMKIIWTLFLAFNLFLECWLIWHCFFLNAYYVQHGPIHDPIWVQCAGPTFFLIILESWVKYAYVKLGIMRELL